MNIERLRPATDARDKATPIERPPAKALDRDCHQQSCLAVIPAQPSAGEFTLMRRLAIAFLAKQPQLAIFVAGTTFDDERLMSHPNVFVSGAIAPQELERLARHCRRRPHLHPGPRRPATSSPALLGRARRACRSPTIDRIGWPLARSSPSISLSPQTCPRRG